MRLKIGTHLIYIETYEGNLDNFTVSHLESGERKISAYHQILQTYISLKNILSIKMLFLALFTIQIQSFTPVNYSHTSNCWMRIE